VIEPVLEETDPTSEPVIEPVIETNVPTSDYVIQPDLEFGYEMKRAVVEE
jgi:hypothetical protein